MSTRDVQKNDVRHRLKDYKDFLKYLIKNIICGNLFNLWLKTKIDIIKKPDKLFHQVFREL